MIHLRFQEFLEVIGKERKDYCKASGISKHTLGKILSGDAMPNMDTITKINNTNPNVNLNWLLVGKGEIFND